MERDDSSLNKLSGIPELGNTLRWNNSSNVLCNYMKKQEYLDMVLQNFAIIPRYVIEPLDYLDLKEIKSICFPMTCFCDIPFSKVNTHMSNYGKYGIGLDKNAVLHKYRVQPIHYINAESPLTDDFKEAFSVCMKHNYRGDERVLAAYISSTLMYMKPIWYYQKDKEGNPATYIYQDECEWRYIPSDNFPQDLHLILSQNKTTEKARDKYSEVLAHHEECWLRFSLEDICYIIVPDENAVKKTILTIRGLDIKEEKKDILVSKIEISKRFSEDM